MRKLARTIPVAVVVSTALMALPSGASAATQIGQTVDPAGSFCSANTTWLQSISPSNGSFAVPSDGVITSWSFQGGDIVPTGLKLKVGQVGATSLTIVGESSSQNPVANQLNSFPTKVTVHTGDVIGFYNQTAGRCAAPNQVGYAEVFANGDILPPGGTGSPITTETNVHLDVSALLEPDCDKDGLGDQTQDGDLSTCAPGTTPTGPVLGPGGTPVTCKGKPATIVGTDGSDVRTGSPGPDVIVGRGGKDTLSGLGGNDVICGGPGKDTLKGGGGKDTLLGQGGKDVCEGGKGKDTASKCEVKKSI